MNPEEAARGPNITPQNGIRDTAENELILQSFYEYLLLF